jgi:hypothetical protein
LGPTMRWCLSFRANNALVLVVWGQQCAGVGRLGPTMRWCWLFRANNELMLVVWGQQCAYVGRLGPTMRWCLSFRANNELLLVVWGQQCADVSRLGPTMRLCWSLRANNALELAVWGQQCPGVGRFGPTMRDFPTSSRRRFSIFWLSYILSQSMRSVLRDFLLEYQLDIVRFRYLWTWQTNSICGPISPWSCYRSFSVSITVLTKNNMIREMRVRCALYTALPTRHSPNERLSFHLLRITIRQRYWRCLECACENVARGMRYAQHYLRDTCVEFAWGLRGICAGSVQYSAACAWDIFRAR